MRCLETLVLALLVVLAACGVDRGALNPGTDGGGRLDSGLADAGMDSGIDAGTDAATARDSGHDAAITSDASNDDAGAVDAGDAGDAGTLTCSVDEDCALRSCHEANCATGRCIYTPQPFGLAADEPQPLNDCQAVYCDGNGGTIVVGDSLDSPLDDGDFCTLEACSGTTPAHVALPNGTQLPLSAQVPGDCAVKRCSGGQTVDEPDDQDRPASTECVDGTCNAGVPGTLPRSAGLVCGTDLVCDDLGECVACLAQTASCTEDWQCCGGDCVGGQCGVACLAQHADCDANDANGCETPINTVSDCGACDTTCALSNAGESCATGTCVITSCSNGFDDCNGNDADGCERSLRSLTDCGSCGTACARNNAAATCATGTCALGACDPSWGNCDNNATNGCETAINTLTNCGACGLTCSFANATASCSSGVCERISCDAGFGDCDNAPGNGCEAALNTVTDCGTCGNACTGPANRAVSCDMGACNVGACVAGFQDCDGVSGNGCEWNVNNGACPCVGSADSDGDGLTNCNEIEDGNAFTDPDIFNGAHVTHYPICAQDGVFGTNVSCSDYDTLAEVNTCTSQAAALESLDQRAGWDWEDPAGSNNPINAAGFGFLPNWSRTDTSFQLDAQAFINLTQSGRHCFRVNGDGGIGSSCASVYLSATAASDFCGWSTLPADTASVVQHGDNAVCLQLNAGVYPFRWHFDRDPASMGDLHLDYCYGGASSNCAPVDAVPSRMLRVSYPSTCQVPADNCTQGTFNGHDYWFCETALSWSAARTACQSVGMDLANVNATNENAFLYNAIETDHWIGLGDSLSEGTWMWFPSYTPIWSNGTTLPNSYVNWANNEPNGGDTRDCAEMLASNGRWNDSTCATAQPFICEER